MGNQRSHQRAHHVTHTSSTSQHQLPPHRQHHHRTTALIIVIVIAITIIVVTIVVSTRRTVATCVRSPWTPKTTLASSRHRPHHRHRHHHRRHERRVNIVLIPTPRRTVATCVRSPWRTMAPFQQYIDTHAPCDRSSVRSHAKSCVYHVVSAHNTSVLMHTNTGHRRTSYRTKHPILTHSHPPHPSP